MLCDFKWTWDIGASRNFRPFCDDDVGCRINPISVEVAGNLNPEEGGELLSGPWGGEVVLNGQPPVGAGRCVRIAGVSEIWTPSHGITIADLSLDQQNAIQRIVQESSGVVRPDVVDDVPYLSNHDARGLRLRMQKETSTRSDKCDRDPIDSIGAKCVVLSARKDVQQAVFPEEEVLTQEWDIDSAFVDEYTVILRKPTIHALVSKRRREAREKAHQKQLKRADINVLHDLTHTSHVRCDDCSVCKNSKRIRKPFERGGIIPPSEQGIDRITFDWCGPIPSGYGNCKWLAV